MRPPGSSAREVCPSSDTATSTCESRLRPFKGITMTFLTPGNPRSLVAAMGIGCAVFALSSCGGSEEIQGSASVEGRTYAVRSTVVEAFLLGSGGGNTSGVQPARCDHPIG